MADSRLTTEMASPTAMEAARASSATTARASTSEALPDLNLNRRFQHNYFVSFALLVLAAASFCWADTQLADPSFFAWMPGDARKFIGLSEAFAHGFGVLLIALVIWFLAPTAIRFVPRIALCAFWPALIVQGIKGLFGRWRPIRFFDEASIAQFPLDQRETWIGWMSESSIHSGYFTQSFPSGHTATAWGLAIGMTFAFPQGRWLFIFLAILASLQRVMVYAHWPSDVLVGAAIAFCFAGALTQRWGVGRLLDVLEAKWQT